MKIIENSNENSKRGPKEFYYFLFIILSCKKDKINNEKTSQNKLKKNRKKELKLNPWGCMLEFGW